MPSSPSQKPSLLQSLLDTLSSVLDALSFSIALHEKKNNPRFRTPPQDNTTNATTGRQDSTFAPLRVVIESTPPPPTPTEEEKAKNEREEKRKENTEKREGRKFIAEIAIAFVTALLLGVNVWLVLTARRSNQIASDSLKANKQSAWLDKRAWLNVGVERAFQFEDLKPMFLPIQLDNPGATPGRNLTGSVILTILRKGEQPDFSRPQWSYNIQTPVLIPHFHKAILIPALNKKTGKQEVLTPEIHKGMTTGTMFMVIQGKLEYVDAWKVSHWIHFCDTIGAAVSASCSDYNATDENEPQQ